MSVSLAPRKMLVIAPAWVGDTVMAGALFQVLQQQHPLMELHVLAPEWTFSVLKCMPAVTKVIPMPIGHGEFNLGLRWRLAQTLKKENYDQAIVLPNSWKSALIPWFARIPVRTGWLGEWRVGLLNDVRRLDVKKTPLMVQQYVALGVPNGAPLPNPILPPRLTVDPVVQRAALLKLDIVLTDKPILALGAGAEFGSSKRWPPAYYAEIAKQMQQLGWQVWLFGSPKDRAITDAVNALTGDQCVNLAGRTELTETIALLALANKVLTNDSGLMHMAAALAKPLVAVYGSTSPAFTPPLSDQATVLQLHLPCQPCFQRECPLKHHRCMKGLLPAQVFTALEALK